MTRGNGGGLSQETDGMPKMGREVSFEKRDYLQSSKEIKAGIAESHS